MSIGDFLKGVGGGLEKAGRVAGTVLEPIGKAVAEEESGELPEIQKEKRQQKQKAQDEVVARRAKFLENQLALDQKYGTLTPEKRTQLNQEYQSLGAPKKEPSIWQHLLKGGATYQQPSAKYSGDATPEGGTEGYKDQTARSQVEPNLQAKVDAVGNVLRNANVDPKIIEESQAIAGGAPASTFKPEAENWSATDLKFRDGTTRTVEHNSKSGEYRTLGKNPISPEELDGAKSVPKTKPLSESLQSYEAHVGTPWAAMSNPQKAGYIAWRTAQGATVTDASREVLELDADNNFHIVTLQGHSAKRSAVQGEPQGAAPSPVAPTPTATPSESGAGGNYNPAPAGFNHLFPHSANEQLVVRDSDKKVFAKNTQTGAMRDVKASPSGSSPAMPTGAKVPDASSRVGPALQGLHKATPDENKLRTEYREAVGVAALADKVIADPSNSEAQYLFMDTLLHSSLFRVNEIEINRLLTRGGLGEKPDIWLQKAKTGGIPPLLMGQLAKYAHDVADSKKTALEAPMPGSAGASPVGGLIKPKTGAQKKKWSKSKYAAANPGKDVNVAAQQAQAQGKEVIP